MRNRMASRLCAVLCTGLLVMSAALVAAPRRALAEGYTYTVRVFGGNEGLVNGQEVYEVGQFAYGEECKLDTSWVTHTDGSAYSAEDGSKYYVKGFRVSGQDNRDSESRELLSHMAFDVTEDIDLVVAYGAKGEMVSYTVNFVEYGSGNPLMAEIADGTTADHVTFLGKKGDKVVVPYEYVPGYRPRYKNITGTLGDEGTNVWTLEYISLEPAPGTAGAPTPSAPTVPEETGETGTEGTATETATTTVTTGGGTTTTTGGGTTTTTTVAGGGTTTTTGGGTTTTTTTTTTGTAAAGTQGNAAAGNAAGNEGNAAADNEGNAAADNENEGGENANAGDNEGNADDAGANAGEPETPAEPEPPATEEILDVDNPLAAPDSGQTSSDNGNNGPDTTAAADAASGFPINGTTIAIIAAIIVALALAVFFFLRRKNEIDEDDLDSYV